MYSMDTYFLEILSLPVPGDGWTAEARFSRQSDYRKHADVPKVTYPTHIFQPTKPSVEKAVAEWARKFIANSSDVIESSLRIQEESHAR
jgi:hypothetical protein